MKLHAGRGRGSAEGTHREEGVDDVSLDGAERLVSDHHKDLLLLLQADEVTKPRPLGQSADKPESHM